MKTPRVAAANILLVAASPPLHETPRTKGHRTRYNVERPQAPALDGGGSTPTGLTLLAIGLSASCEA